MFVPKVILRCHNLTVYCLTWKDSLCVVDSNEHCWCYLIKYFEYGNIIAQSSRYLQVAAYAETNQATCDSSATPRIVTWLCNLVMV